VTHDAALVIEIFGEGKTDVGTGTGEQPPTKGVLPILVHRLCDRPPQMVVKRRAYAFLQGKGLSQKVRFAKRQANYNRSAGAVFVMDSEGDERERQKKHKELTKGRDQELPDFPMAIGVAHPCIEAWLLADDRAIAWAIGPSAAVNLPAEPERLPAPQRDERNNPKAILAGLGARSTAEKDAIALAMNDMDLVCQRCRLGFAPFAHEVRQLIRPLFCPS
jgi:hypothetical protein